MEMKKAVVANKVVYHPPFLTDDPLVVDKGYCHFNRKGLKDFVNCVLEYGVEGGVVTFRAETWRSATALVKISFVSDTAYRVQMFPFEKVPEVMYPVYDFKPINTVDVKEDDLFIYASTARLTLQIRKNPWEITTILDGKELTKEQIQDLNVDQRYKDIPFGFTFEGDKATDCFETMYLHADESFYGFGEKYTGFDKRGQKLTIWQRDAQSCDADVSYKAYPYFVSSYGFSVLLNTFTRNHFNMGATSGISYNMEVEDPYLDYYMFCNRNFKGLVSDYTALAGRVPMAPRFAFGYMQSKMGYRSREEVENIIAKCREDGIPLDVINLDGGGWMDGSSDEPYEWGRERFPDPENWIPDLKKRGIRLMCWMNPYVGKYKRGSDEIGGVFKNMAAKGWLVKNAEGEPYLFSSGEGNPNNRGSAAYDLTIPECREYIKSRIKRVIKMGVGIIKTDFGEEVPADAVFADGTIGVQSHNKFIYLYQKTWYEACKEAKEEMGLGEMPLLWGRCGYAGNHVNPANWAGDSSGAKNTTFALCNGGLSMGMSGVAFWGYDLGGFYYADYEGKRACPNEEEYLRSIQLGLMSPMSRCHSQATDREPFRFSKATEDAFIKMDKLRYRLLPYIYSAAYEAHNYGYPMMRAMVLEYPEDYTVKSMSTEYMFGESILVAPVFDQYVQHVYLPAGSWLDIWTGDRIEGGCWITPEIRPDHMPIFVRADRAIPMLKEAPMFIEDKNWEDISLLINLVDKVEGTYFDDGVVGSYKAQIVNGNLEVTIENMDVTRLVVSAKKTIGSVIVNGEVWASKTSDCGKFVIANK